MPQRCARACVLVATSCDCFHLMVASKGERRRHLLDVMFYGTHGPRWRSQARVETTSYTFFSCGVESIRGAAFCWPKTSIPRGPSLVIP